MDDQPVETTIYSLAGEPPAEPLQERPERFLSLLRVGTLIVADRRELCLIRNISAGGMMIRAYSPIRPGDTLAVELKQGEPVSGKVAWVKDGAVGVVFDTPIDVLELIAPADDGPRPRMPRIEVNAIAWVREGANIRRTRLSDVSQGGVCVTTAVPLTEGAEVIVTLTGLPPMPATVRWREGERYGVGFNRVIALADLVIWLQGQRAQATPAKMAV